jgi:hypothetical protein
MVYPVRHGGEAFTIQAPRDHAGTEPGHWELRAFTVRDQVTGRPRQATRTFHGTEKEGGKAGQCH